MHPFKVSDVHFVDQIHDLHFHSENLKKKVIFAFRVIAQNAYSPCSPCDLKVFTLSA